MEHLSLLTGPCSSAECGCQRFWDATMKDTYEIRGDSERSVCCVCVHGVGSHAPYSAAAVCEQTQGTERRRPQSGTCSNFRIADGPENDPNVLPHQRRHRRRHPCQSGMRRRPHHVGRPQPQLREVLLRKLHLSIRSIRLFMLSDSTIVSLRTHHSPFPLIGLVGLPVPPLCSVGLSDGGPARVSEQKPSSVECKLPFFHTGSRTRSYDR